MAGRHLVRSVPAEPGDLLAASWPGLLRVCCSTDDAASEGVHVIAAFDRGSITVHPRAFSDTRTHPPLLGAA